MKSFVRSTLVLVALLAVLAACQKGPGSQLAVNPEAPAPQPTYEVPEYTPPPVETPAPAPKAPAKTITRTPTTTHKKTVTKQSSTMCDPNYKGACLKPNVSDYDCAGGSGDGPYYAEGPFQSVGSDPYGLDRDHDGIACE